MDVDFLFGPEDLQTARPGAAALAEDLRLDVLLEAMAGGDRRAADACGRLLCHPLTDADAIAARSAVRGDVAAHPELFAAWRQAADEALDGAARYAEFRKPRYDRIISNQKKLLTETKVARLHLQCLRRIREAISGEEPGAFRSPAVRAFLESAGTRCRAENLARMEARLDTLDSLKQSDDITLGASLGSGLRPANALLRELGGQSGGRRNRKRDGTAIPLSSVALIQNAEDAVQSAVLPLLRMVADFNREMQQFEETLSFALCFYLGCARLRERLEALGAAVCEPRIHPGAAGVESRNLRNAALALQENQAPTGNDINLDGKRLILVTGANQGGKTTFLRSLGLAQLMAQCGLFIAAETYRCPLYGGVYTHFPSGEDAARGMGLLDVELQKLSGIVDCIRPHSLLLLNETFQTTMPQDAQYLAEAAVRALTDSGVTVVFVTHLYAYAAARYAERGGDTLFLRADRESGFRLREGAPCASAEGEALYREVLNG